MPQNTLDKVSYRAILETELARAEAVIEDASGSKKLHEPMVENHRGQIMALRKAITFLEMVESHPPGAIKLEKEYRVNIPWRTIVVAGIILIWLSVNH